MKQRNWQLQFETRIKKQEKTNNSQEKNEYWRRTYRSRKRRGINLKNQILFESLSPSYHDLHQWTYWKSMDRWYLPVVVNQGLRHWPRRRTTYVLTTQEGARNKSPTTWVDLRERRSTTRPNSARVLQGTNRSERGPSTDHRK